jgi:hypothetical protein
MEGLWINASARSIYTNNGWQAMTKPHQSQQNWPFIRSGAVSTDRNGDNVAVSVELIANDVSIKRCDGKVHSVIGG